MPVACLCTDLFACESFLGRQSSIVPSRLEAPGARSPRREYQLSHHLDGGMVYTDAQKSRVGDEITFIVCLDKFSLVYHFMTVLSGRYNLVREVHFDVDSEQEDM